MSSKSKNYSLLQKIGIGLFLIGLIVFTAVLWLDKYQVAPSSINVSNEYHQSALMKAAKANGFFEKEYSTSYALMDQLKATFETAQSDLDQQAAKAIPEGVQEWDFKLGFWKFKEYFGADKGIALVKNASVGTVSNNPMMWWLLSFGLGILGGLMFILPKFLEAPGIKNNHIYHDAMERGLTWGWRTFFLSSTIVGVLLYGIKYMSKDWFWPAVTLGVMILIAVLVMVVQKSREQNPARSASPASFTAWLGIVAGIYLIGFYVLLYWAPQHMTGWITMHDPISEFLNGGPASQWFVYGVLYTIIVAVMGIRMYSKYRHNRYQMVRTSSVIFFQTAFAFLIPQILTLLNQPSMDLKNIWPLNYTFFFDWNINNLMSSGGLGIFMLVWGIVLVIIGVPLITYFYGKRWYCSWVCGCGGLAETMGDPYRQLSDKSLRAWHFERYIIHGVLVFAVIMTAMVLYTYFTGNQNVIGMNTGKVREWYGFVIGAGFAGIVGTGFYPLMGNRTWCRFGCPLAAYLGLVQKYKSRFRITTNGSQCISCGNCSTYCEMGIDVRHYAQRGQDIVRASCVGCGVCAAVCPRGVLKLENNDSDIKERAVATRAIHITEDQIQLLS